MHFEITNYKNFTIGFPMTRELLITDKFIGDEKLENELARLSKDRIERIQLRGNCITQIGANHTSLFLAGNSTLKYLSLEWNQIGIPWFNFNFAALIIHYMAGNQGLILICDALKENNALQYLDLRNNGISDEGAIYLASSLINNFTIKSVDLRWNQIGDEGVLPFKEIIRVRFNSLLLISYLYIFNVVEFI